MEHLALARGTRELKLKLGEDVKGGRPKGSGTKAEAVRAWREAHPDGNKSACSHDTGISRVTVSRWRNMTE